MPHGSRWLYTYLHYDQMIIQRQPKGPQGLVEVAQEPPFFSQASKRLSPHRWGHIGGAQIKFNKKSRTPTDIGREPQQERHKPKISKSCKYKNAMVQKKSVNVHK